MRRKSSQYGPNVRPLLAGAGHIGRMSAVPVLAASSAPRLPRSPALARAARTCRRNFPNERVATALGRCPYPPSSLRLTPVRALLLLLSFGSAAVYAQPVATSRMGLTSRGTVHISVSVAPRVEVSRSAVMAAESGGADGTQSFCVWSNSAVGSYSISASNASDGSTGEPVGDRFPLDVQLAAAGTGTIPLSLAPGASATGLTAASGDGCRSERLVIRPAELASGNPGAARSATLLLLIAPD